MKRLAQHFRTPARNGPASATGDGPESRSACVSPPPISGNSSTAPHGRLLRSPARAWREAVRCAPDAVFPPPRLPAPRSHDQPPATPASTPSPPTTGQPPTSTSAPPHDQHPRLAAHFPRISVPAPHRLPTAYAPVTARVRHPAAYTIIWWGDSISPSLAATVAMNCITLVANPPHSPERRVHLPFPRICAERDVSALQSQLTESLVRLRARELTTAVCDGARSQPCVQSTFPPRKVTLTATRSAPYIHARRERQCSLAISRVKKPAGPVYSPRILGDRPDVQLSALLARGRCARAITCIPAPVFCHSARLICTYKADRAPFR